MEILKTSSWGFLCIKKNEIHQRVYKKSAKHVKVGQIEVINRSIDLLRVIQSKMLLGQVKNGCHEASFNAKWRKCISGSFLRNLAKYAKVCEVKLGLNMSIWPT